MFTGIVEEIGESKGIKRGEKSSVLVVKANKVLDKLKLGDSICTNGVCLTVTNINRDTFEADVMAVSYTHLDVYKRQNVDSIITDNPFLVSDTIYWKKNDFIKIIADYLF